MIYLLQLLLSMSFAAQAQNTPFQFTPKVQSQVIQSLSKQQTVDVIVFMKDSADLSSVRSGTKEDRTKRVYDLLRTKAMESQKALIAYLESHNQNYRPYYITNAVFVKNATPQLVSEISKREDVRSILSNPKIQNRFISETDNEIDLRKVSKKTSVENNIVYIGAKKVWDDLKITGQNIVVAGQDTGVEWDHPALIKHYRGYNNGKVNHNYNWHDSTHNSQGSSCGSDAKAPCDDNDHGTHTIGTVVGNDGAQNEIGVAPGAKWIACKNMDAGVGRPSTYIECFEWLLAPYPAGGNPMRDGDPKKAPHVVNNSWSCPPDEGCKGEEFLPILDAMEKAGIMVVVSAGNEGPSCGSLANPPGDNSDNVLSVAAMDHRNGKIAYFSSRGPSALDGKIGPHVAAPGVNIRSSVPGKKYAGPGWSGTSMAGPHVVGEVALMWAANPKLIGNVAKTKEIIEETAKKTDAEVSCGEDVTARPNNTYGYGIIDVYAAVKKAMEYK